MMNSIRSKLLIAFTGTIFCVTTAAAIAVYWEVKDEANELFDYQLKQMATVFLNTNTISLNAFNTKNDMEEVDDDFALVVYDAQNKKLFSSGLDFSVPYPNATGYQSQLIDREKWHSFALKNSKKTVLVLQPEKAREKIAASTAFMAIVPFLIAFPVFGILIWLIIRQGLLPLRDFQKKVALLDEHSLEPLAFSSMPLELKPLGDALNTMIKRLKIAIDARKNFIADAAHELRTPLAVLKLQLELAQKLTNTQDVQSSLNNLEKGVERANRLVEQLLTLARQERSEADRLPAKINMTQIVTDIVVSSLPFAEAKGVELEVRRIEQIYLTADEHEIQTAVANLVDNAIRYTPAGGIVSLNLYSQNHHAVLNVIDSGIGIKDDEKKRIFDRFYRVNNDSIGSGLGLSIVREICQKYGAKLTVGDNSPHGAIFSIEFPGSVS